MDNAWESWALRRLMPGEMVVQIGILKAAMIAMALLRI